jgi:hypothetical protein
MSDTLNPPVASPLPHLGATMTPQDFALWALRIGLIALGDNLGERGVLVGFPWAELAGHVAQAAAIVWSFLATRRQFARVNPAAIAQVSASLDALRRQLFSRERAL